MTPFQEAIHERLQVAKDQIDSVMEIDENFQEHLEEVQGEMHKTNVEKAGKNPGHAIKNMLTKWADEPTFSAEEIDKYGNELWVTLAEFEKYLREQEFGMETELKNLKVQYRTRVDGIRA